MNAGPLPVNVSPVFMDRLFELQEYLGRLDAGRGRQFVSDVFDFIYEAVGPFPLAFPAYALPKYPALALRRAVFRRRYNLVYEVGDTEIKFLTIFGTAQDTAGIEL